MPVLMLGSSVIEIGGGAVFIPGGGGGAAPAAPTNLFASPNTTQVQLAWTASVGATSYNVKRSTTNGSGYVTIASPTTAYYFDTGRTNGTTYYYVVTAVNASGESVISSQVSGVPGAPAVAPSTNMSFSPTSGSPGSVITFTATASPGNFTGALSSDSGELANDGSGAINDGIIVVLSDSVALWIVPGDAKTGQPYLGNGANHGYGFAGTPFTWTFVPIAVPSNPTGVSAVADPAGAAVDLSWSPASNTPTHYTVQRSTTSGSGYTSVGTPTGTTFVDTGLTNGTEYFYVISATNVIGTSGNSTEVNATPTAPAVGVANIEVTAATTQPISPYIYGINISALNLFPALTLPAASIYFNRLGGNRWTAYNWQTNASNAGSDSNYTNDNGLSTSSTPLDAITTHYFNADRSAAIVRASMMTVQIQGYVAADESGTVARTNPIQTTRFKTVVFAKGSAFTTTPANTNASVYIDEMVWALDQHYSGSGIFTNSPTVAPVFIELDNEPDIWQSTHQEVQTSTVCPYATFFSKSTSAAAAIKTQFPQAKIVGPAISTFASMYYWDGSWPGPAVGTATWLIDGYMAAMKSASVSFGAQLLDILSLHMYSNITVGGTATTSLTGTSLTSAQTTAVVNSSRSFDDPNFVEPGSYVTTDTNIGATNYLPRINSHIAAAGYTTPPKFSITEYYNGGANHISGLISQAGMLGAFGANGVHSAALWPIQASPLPLGAFSCFNNFDGAGAKFGDTSVLATSMCTVPITTTNGSALLSVSNASNASILGMPVTFDNTIGTGAGQLLAGTTYFVSAQTTTSISVSATYNYTSNPPAPGASIVVNSNGAANATFPNNGNVTAYVSTDSSQPGRVVAVILNRSFVPQTVTISGIAMSGTAHIWQVTASSATPQGNTVHPVTAGTQSVSGSSATFAGIPALSVTTIDMH